MIKDLAGEAGLRKPVGNAAGRHLVVCETNYALFVVILLRCNGVISGNCDIVFTDALDFSATAEVLRETSLFDDIWCVKTRKLVTGTIRMPRDERRAVARHPEAFMPLPFAGRRYTDLWLNLDGLCPKYYYYSLVNLGSAPRVHFVEEGNSSYFLNLETLKRDAIPHAEFGELRFGNACKELWLFDPDRFLPENVAFSIRQIPREAVTDQAFLQVVARVFEQPALSDRPFVYFEQCFDEDGHVTNDLELVMRIAGVLGKENISIRLHPRTKEDRFKPFGFATIASGPSLWEAALLREPEYLSDKVVITVDSTAAFSSLKLFGMPTESILLDKVVWGQYKGKDSAEKDAYFDAMVEASNERRICCYRPRSLEELDVIVGYHARKARHDE